METEGYLVRVRDTGYVQYIDSEYVLTLARERNLVIRLLRKPGHFFRRGAVVALVWPAGRFDEGLEGQIRNAFQIGNQRTPPRMSNTLSTSSSKWPYEPCLRRSMTPSLL